MFEDWLRDGSAPIGNSRWLGSLIGLFVHHCRAVTTIARSEPARTGCAGSPFDCPRTADDRAKLLEVALAGPDGAGILACRSAPGWFSRSQERRQSWLANDLARLAKASRFSLATEPVKMWVMTRLETCPTLFHRFRASHATWTTPLKKCGAGFQPAHGRRQGQVGNPSS